ncbi:MAG: hypothetical protein ABJM06_13745 [Gilvibacter sp.]
MKKLLSTLIICTLISPLIISCDSGGDDTDPPMTDDTSGTDDTTDDSSDDTTGQTDDTTDTTSFYRLTREERRTVGGPLFAVLEFEYNSQGYLVKYVQDNIESGLVSTFEFEYEEDRIISASRGGSVFADFEYDGDLITVQTGFYDPITLRQEFFYDASGSLINEKVYTNGTYSCENNFVFDGGNRIVWDYACQVQYFEYTHDNMNNPYKDFYPIGFATIIAEGPNNVLTSHETLGDVTITNTYIYNSLDYITQRNFTQGAFDYEYTYTYETLEL